MTTKTVLVVDDDESYSASLAQLLGELGEVEAVNSIADALGRLDHKYFDMVICDCDLPGKSGLWLLAHIHVAYRATKRILHSARAPEHLPWLLRSGMLDRYIAKPTPFDTWRELLGD